MTFQFTGTAPESEINSFNNAHDCLYFQFFSIEMFYLVDNDLNCEPLFNHLNSLIDISIQRRFCWNLIHSVIYQTLRTNAFAHDVAK